MTEDEFVIRTIDQDDRLRDWLNDSYTSASMENIKEIRNLIIQFIIVSSGIIGFTIPVFSSSNLVISQTLLTGGLLELLIVIIFGFFYLTHLLQKENNELTKQLRKYNEFLDHVRDARNEFLKRYAQPNKSKKMAR